MLWANLMRIGSVLSLFGTAKQFYDLRYKDIKPTRMYRSRDVARLMGISRKDVVRLIYEGKLVAHMVDENYQIPGQNILNFLAKKQDKK